MKNISIKRLFKNEHMGNTIILMASILLLYLLISIYFAKHFFFNTVINSVNVSLKSAEAAEDAIKNHVLNYELQLMERDNEAEKVNGQDIGMQHNEGKDIFKICHNKSSFKWIASLFRPEKYYIEDLFIYNEDELENKINALNCLNKEIVEPRNVDFKYSDGSYEIIEEVYGNKIDENKLKEAIEDSILKGETKLNLDEKLCYENPKYTLTSEKTSKTKDLLDKYVKAKITYKFDEKKETLDGNRINEWLRVDENLDIKIDEIQIMKYLRELSKKYDTVGIARNFKTSTGKIVVVEGGLYGWKIDRDAETKALLRSIKLGEVVEKEPIYTQRALHNRGENEIGNTYVEINITKQHLWFYKNGRLLSQGDIVTGNPNRGHSTVLGTYMLNYKQKGANLRGPGYEAPVTYWMPFFGNIGIHDATWRHSFGGEIYKRNGSHGCVNAPKYLAKKIYENIEDGTPIICYEE